MTEVPFFTRLIKALTLNLTGTNEEFILSAKNYRVPYKVDPTKKRPGRLEFRLFDTRVYNIDSNRAPLFRSVVTPDSVVAGMEKHIMI